MNLLNDVEIIVSLLGVKGIGNLSVFKLYDKFKSFKKIEEYFKNENNKKLYKNFYDIKNALETNKGKEYIKSLQKYNGNLITFFDDNYPIYLRHIYNPPVLLQYIGSIEKINSNVKNIAIIGSRKATGYGRRAAYDLGYNLSKYNVNIISGLAYGVDVHAHVGTIDGGGFPVGVIGNGIDQIYPKENEKTYNDVKEKGVLLTEEFLFSKPAPYKFPLRNRIISGIADAIVVIEAGERSGSLITANYGLENGKTILALPGSIYSEMSRGSNKLIKEGAFLLDSYKDLVDILNLEEKKFVDSSCQNENLGKMEKIIINILSQYGTMTLEKICENFDKDINQVIATITSLEMKGIIKNIGVDEYFIEKNH